MDFLPQLQTFLSRPYPWNKWKMEYIKLGMKKTRRSTASREDGRCFNESVIEKSVENGQDNIKIAAQFVLYLCVAINKSPHF